MDDAFAAPTPLPFLVGLVALLVLSRVPLRYWLRARDAGIDLPFLNLFGMRFRRVDPARIVDPLITARKAGIVLESDYLEGHYLAGGDVERVVQALVAARTAGIGLTFVHAAALDLGGYDVLELVRSSAGQDDFRRRLALAAGSPSRTAAAGTR